MSHSSATTLAARWVRPEIQSLKAYPVPNHTGLIKLDAMENPYIWPQNMRDEWSKLLQEVAVNRYPDPEATQLKQQLQTIFNIPDIASIMLGNGSDELIQIIALALGGPGRVVLSIEPSFVMYRMLATCTGITYIGIPLTATNFSLDTEAILIALKKYQPAVVFLAYP
ncbi:histidinol-phosphate aminotransferase, partial [Achromatium sp. WMS1]